MAKPVPKPQVVEKVVEDLLAKHTGGIPFFDSMDETWRITRKGWCIVADLADHALNEYPDHRIVASGRFGMFLHNAFDSFVQERLLLVTGGLRTTAPMDDLTYIGGWIHDREFVFIDDSFYSGRTRDLIKAEIERHGGTLEQTLVIYDGSKVKDEAVEAMYRYYDHYSPDPSRANPNVKHPGPL